MPKYNSGNLPFPHLSLEFSEEKHVQMRVYWLFLKKKKKTCQQFVVVVWLNTFYKGRRRNVFYDSFLIIPYDRIILTISSYSFIRKPEINESCRYWYPFQCFAIFLTSQCNNIIFIEWEKKNSLVSVAIKIHFFSSRLNDLIFSFF